MDTRAQEFSWAAKLTDKTKVVTWGGSKDGALEQLVMKLAVLGSGAKKGERNLVEVTTFDSAQKKLKTCICALTLGVTENIPLADMSLYPPLNFTLVEGSGPVHIVGTHLLLDDDDLSEDEDDDDVSEFEEEDLKPKLKKKQSGKGDGPKMKKMVEEDEDLDDDSDEQEDEEDSKTQKKKMNSLIEMEAEEEDDDDDDEDIDDDSEEEEVKAVEAPSKKRKLDNGKAAKAAQKSMASPDRGGKKAPEGQKTPKLQKKENGQTPKSAKKTPSKPTFKSVEEVRAAIAKYPGGKPRKQDKFLNWVQNQFKVSDDAWKGALWNWHKKELGL